MATIELNNTPPVPITSAGATPTGSQTTPQANPQDKNPNT